MTNNVYLCHYSEWSFMEDFIRLSEVLPRVPDVVFSQPFTFTMRKNEIWTFYGPNGSGKSLLSEIISGRYGLSSGRIEYPFMEEERAKTNQFIYPRQFIQTIHFQSTYSFSDFRDAYYQQRFNVYEVDWYPTVDAVLQVRDDVAWREQVIDIFSLRCLLNHRLITLSSGQLRRLLMAKALLDKPRMMVFDNPFIGLDKETRLQMEGVFSALMQQGIQLLFLVADARDIPMCTTHVLQLEKLVPVYVGPYHPSLLQIEKDVLPPFSYAFTPSQLGNEDYRNVVEMRHVCIQYDGMVFQSDINWQIGKGEKWALLGPNGSGKSTLLSYIFADNPQGYSLSLWLFDRKRGSGESIWDIKKRIGYTSSEMHLYYRENVSCLKVVESGYFDSVGLYCRCTEQQQQHALVLMKQLGVAHLAERSFLKVSSGEQRLLLFARALIKNPQLLILDEPFHGLDKRHKQRCLELIECYGSQRSKSLIFVTHYQQEIPACVQHVYQLEAPQILKNRT